MTFKLTSNFQPAGDQPQAIKKTLEALNAHNKHHILLGVTGSGKTFTVANVIAKLGVPALVIAPNKTLAAQLYTEFKGLLSHDQVGFFISFYDYYQPEAYLPASDTYIAKDSSINDDIDKMRHHATRILFEEKNVVIVASVSCIYGLGSPKAYEDCCVNITAKQQITRRELLSSLVGIQFSRNDQQLTRGGIRVRGDVIDIQAAHESDDGIRIEMFGNEIESIIEIDPLK